MRLSSRRGVSMRALTAMTVSTSFVLLFGLSACTKRDRQGSQGPETAPTAETPNKQDKSGGQVSIPSGKLPVVDGSGETITFPGGGFIQLETIAGERYLAVNAVLDDASFKSVAASARAISTSDQERIARMGADLDATIKAMASAKLTRVKMHPEYGFFSALMPLATYNAMPAISGLPHSIVMSPAIRTPLGENAVRVMDQAALAGVDARSVMESFSGLNRMGVPEFLTQIQSELGATADVDGRRVLIGVTDTGVTLNHPTFGDATGQSRIVYMKDFTAEGRVYFNPEARFEVTVPTAEQVPVGADADEVLLLTADVIPPVKGSTAMPQADGLKEIKGNLLVSSELRAILTTAGSGAKLGFLSEAVFTSDSEKVDLNQNGKSDDLLAMILLPTGDAGSYKLYFSPTGNLDFRRATIVGSWNDTKQTIKLSAEKFGFDIIGTTLSTTEGDEVPVVAASIVGFDPGNHGSHVSGIIAGRSTFANDSADTLARGASPNAKFMVNRVCANNGGCGYTEAVIDLAEAGAELVNLSIGGLSPFNDGYNVDEILMDRLTEIRNTLFVISAGNSGPGINTVGSPSTGRHAISVAATASRALIERQYQWPAKGKSGPLAGLPTVEDEDFLLFFSSRGPSAAGGFKPDIAAPGTELSSIQLNSASGLQAGLAVYWGTSMAAPSATGAIALLLDAAKRYNELYPETKLPLDALTLRKVVVASARPFDVTRLDTTTGEFSRGQYTWIDQGLGMINLPRAWAALKAERDTRLPSAVAIEKDGVRQDIDVDYQVRVLRTSPNGINYDGSLELPADVMAVTGPRFGRGIWLDAKDTDNLVQVQIARRLPTSAASRDDVGDLKRLLLTTKDEFVLKTIVFGSNTPWVKAGVLNQLSCETSPTGQLTVVGGGAIDAFDAETGPRSLPQNDSTLNVCIDRAALNSLPAGDHGALILAYRTQEGHTEANPSFIVPVYVTLPQKTLAGSATFERAGTVQSFGVDRHYVDVPEGVSLVTVKVEVPEAKVAGTAVTGCMGVRLYVYEAGNTSTPGELAAGTASIARNCSDAGRAQNGSRIVTYSRTNPTAGIWNLLIFGRYQFASSDYKLTVEYAKVKTTPTEVAGAPAALNGSVRFEVLDSSFEATPTAHESSFKLGGFLQKTQEAVAEGETIDVADRNGTVARSYGTDVANVTITTGGSTGNDLDLYVLECADAELSGCQVVGQSAGSTDVESVDFAPVVGKFYVATVMGYTVTQNNGRFDFAETRSLAHPEQGSVEVTTVSEGVYDIAHAFDVASSALLVSPLFTSGDFQLIGSLAVRTATGALMTQVPVIITHQAAE